jgi:hypothetical protein
MIRLVNDGIKMLEVLRCSLLGKKPKSSYTTYQHDCDSG